MFALIEASPAPSCISLCAWGFASVRSEIFGRALRSPCVAGTATKRVYDEYMTFIDYCNALVMQF